jgi:hypothetical protein
MELNSDGWLSALPIDIRLGWKEQTVTNTLAYYAKAKITAVKSFIVRALCVSSKSAMAVIVAAS